MTPLCPSAYDDVEVKDVYMMIFALQQPHTAVFIKLAREEFVDPPWESHAPGGGGTYEEQGLFTTFSYWPPQFYMHGDVPITDEDEITVWPGLRFVDNKLLRTTNPSIEFAYHMRFIDNTPYKPAPAPAERKIKITDAAMDKLLQDFPFLRREDFVSSVAKSIRGTHLRKHRQ